MKKWPYLASLSLLWGSAAAAEERPQQIVVLQAPEQADEEEDEAMEVLRNLASDESARDYGGAVDWEDLEALEGFSGEAEGETAAGGESGSHEVQEGDTLWDLSQRFLGSPYLWPKMWSQNPQLENPHWIYPGDRIRWGEPGEAAPVYTEDVPYFEEEEEVPEVATIGRLAYIPPASERPQSIGFVTEQEIRASAVIEKSWEEKTVLGQGDRIYLHWPERDGVRAGSLFMIYRTDRRISSLGYLTRILGVARVLDAPDEGNYVPAVIEHSVLEIERGDRIGPLRDISRMVERRPNRVDLLARIAGSLEFGQVDFGQGDIVFVDKGRRDGVEVGNVLEVVRATDGLDDDGYTPRYDRTLPREVIGQLLIVDVQEGASAALVIASTREFRVGDRAEMHAYQHSASR